MNSVIDPSAKIDKSVTIGPFCFVGPNVEIGPNCVLHSHVVIKGPTQIDEGNTFYQFSTIGEDTPDKKYNGEQTSLEIGKENIFREGVTVHRGTIQDKSKTVIGDGNLFMAYAHIAHDCEVGNNNVFANTAGLAGHVKVGNNVILGAVTLVHQFCSLGDYSFTGLNTIITMDVPAFVKVAANPARPIGLNSVGMQRNNFDTDTVNLIKKAYRIIYRKGYSLDDAIKHLHALNKDSNPALSTFISSIESSERGLLR
ncbi:MAG: acyl-ACP--UDP-N-acetylglucosamine O-acyltransferase [SAR86 cluster bacterium]|jgi:UDP-N-acetylglucosamine acyltransferase|nr:acyl-ACP--UDP-N-acetylglucosamine O-acyltransferase [Gammaproteobacteria bacterium]MDG0965655.1 acyl-ACP--UDP-N-acetylglucosamine O-acyltransferase [SAR86 cluster bacterium]|tara:strand:+ start:1642 stop:2406 length:765 start_codon:yes stop_codon:yes gene_type:complete